MQYVMGLFGVAVVGLVLVFSFDPSYQQMRRDEAYYHSAQQSMGLEKQRLELDERRAISAVVIAQDASFRVLSVVAGLLAVVLALHLYYQRRDPLVRPDVRGLLPVERRQLAHDDVKQLVADALVAYHESQIARAVHQSGQSPAHLHYAPHYTSRAGAELSSGAADVSSGMPLPEAPTWAALRRSWSPSPEQMLLGYGVDGPLYGSINDLLSTAVAGRPNQGKSTLLRFVYAQVQAVEGAALVWDLHGSITGDLPGLRSCESVDSIERSAHELLAELESRIKSRTHAPLLLLVDEWPVLSLASRRAGAAVSRIVLEGRKYGMYALIAGQGLPADRFGGSLVRDALSSRYVFRTTVAQARMAGLEGDARQLVTNLTPGHAVLAGPVDPQIVAIPNVQPADLREIAGETLPHFGETLEPDETKVSASEREVSRFRLVRELRAAGHEKKEIIRMVWGATAGGGAAYKQASAAYDAIMGDAA